MGRCTCGWPSVFAVTAEHEQEQEPEAPPPVRPLSALDSEVLRVDDRILGLEQNAARTAQDVSVMRDILIDELITIAFVELAVGVVIVVLALAYWREKEHAVD